MQHAMTLVGIYRPPASPIPAFIADFGNLLNDIIASHSNILITGDFNIHVDVPADPHAVRLTSLLGDANFVQHVHQPTHISGHTLDLVMSASYEHLGVSIKNVDRSLSSDHWAVLCSVECTRPPPPTKKLTVRKWKSIDPEELNRELDALLPRLESADDPNADPFHVYTECVTSLCSRLAPPTDIEVTQRIGTPWYNTELRSMKRQCRALERKWKRTDSHIDKDIYHHKRRCLNSLRANTKAEYFKRKLQGGPCHC
jgi:hypothetical protein